MIKNKYFLKNKFSFRVHWSYAHSLCLLFAFKVGYRTQSLIIWTRKKKFFQLRKNFLHKNALYYDYRALRTFRYTQYSIRTQALKYIYIALKWIYTITMRCPKKKRACIIMILWCLSIFNGKKSVSSFPLKFMLRISSLELWLNRVS